MAFPTSIPIFPARFFVALLEAAVDQELCDHTDDNQDTESAKEDFTSDPEMWPTLWGIECN